MTRSSFFIFVLLVLSIAIKYAARFCTNFSIARRCSSGRLIDGWRVNVNPIIWRSCATCVLPITSAAILSKVNQRIKNQHTADLQSGTRNIRCKAPCCHVSKSCCRPYRDRFRYNPDNAKPSATYRRSSVRARS